ncbi:MAG: helix-turn-helix transcriptional regulator [Rhodobacteraceae bacterium]|nr:helix-turn-helix transcriptional regulator [Paracoccaceae bacterium]
MDEAQDWYSEEASTFGDRVAAARENAGMTQKSLAKRLGVRLATLKAWEEDRNEPRANRLSMLAGVLNVSMMWLINGEGEGLGEPEMASDSMNDVMAELRTLRADLVQKAETVARLEKRLRGLTRQNDLG